MTEYPRVYPHPAGLGLKRPPMSDLHPTTGLAGNFALDFMAPGSTYVFAPEKAIVWKLSGHDPAHGVTGGDIFGWNIYLMTPGGVIYFGTHFGTKAVSLGAKVKAGTLIGTVGHWPHDPGRSHTHLGVTHPMGKKASVARIREVSQGRMLPAGDLL